MTRTNVSSRMRILILTERYLPDVTGTSLRMAQLLPPLVSTGTFELHIGTLAGSLTPNERERAVLPPYEMMNGVHVHRFQTERVLASHLISMQRHYRFDLVHARGVRYGFYGRLLSIVSHIPVILELNSVNVQAGFLKSSLWRSVLRSSTRLIVLASYAREWAIHQHGIPRERIDVVVNGVDLNHFSGTAMDAVETRTQLGLKDAAVVIGYAGTFLEWQGVLECVRVGARVLQQLPDARFLMVGAGPDLEKTKQLAIELGVNDRFVFTGLVPPEEVPRYMRAMDIFLLARPPDLLKNQLATPLKLLEAMAAGSAVVITPVQGLTEVVRDRETGLVAHDGSTEAIARAVVEIAIDHPLRSRLVGAARAEIETKYSWKVAAADLSRSYHLAYLARHPTHIEKD